MRNQEKMRAWFRARYHRRRAEYFEGKSCVKCGGTEQLEMDHIDPAQKVDHKIWSWSKERREAEQAKCQILCKDCHLAKSIAEGSVGAIKHGTRNRYRAGCRCDECREWNNAGVRRRKLAATERGEEWPSVERKRKRKYKARSRFGGREAPQS